jgi:hypothetical protein
LFGEFNAKVRRASRHLPSSILHHRIFIGWCWKLAGQQILALNFFVLTPAFTGVLSPGRGVYAAGALKKQPP